MKFNLNNFKGKTTVFKVKDMIKDGKNIYKNIKGFENEINTILTDLPENKTKLKKHIICMNVIYPGKVNNEFKMSRGHSHNVEEVYLILRGNGYLIINNKKIKIKKGDLITIPKNAWHRTINTGKEKLIFLTIFEKHKESHLKKY